MKRRIICLAFVFVLLFNAFAFTGCKKTSVVGKWYCEFTGVEESDPQITFSAFKTFTFRVNLYEGMGVTKGTYRVKGDRVYCSVKSIDFSGFAGDDVYEYVFRFENGDLIYEGEPVGATYSGSRFVRVKK